MRKIIYSRPDGGVCIISVPIDTDDAIAAAMQKMPVDAIDIRVVDSSIIPTDRTFRNAWKTDLTVDIVKAREIQEKCIELKRKEKIRDILEREALGENVATEKASIRAVNARALCATAQTPDELKTIWPDILKE